LVKVVKRSKIFIKLSVYLGSRNNNLYALKVYLPGANKEDAFKREVEFLENLKFPHLINLVDSKINA